MKALKVDPLFVNNSCGLSEKENEHKGRHC